MRPRRTGAFSLVEVVLAMGIVTFGLVVIVALIPASVHSSKQASEDMALSFMTQSIMADLHKRGLTALTNMTPDGTISYYFDPNGRMLPTTTGAHYGCTAKPMTPPAAVNTVNFIYVQLQFAWPLSAPVSNQQTAEMVTSVGNYD